MRGRLTGRLRSYLRLLASRAEERAIQLMGQKSLQTFTQTVWSWQVVAAVISILFGMGSNMTTLPPLVSGSFLHVCYLAIFSKIPFVGGNKNT